MLSTGDAMCLSDSAQVYGGWSSSSNNGLVCGPQDSVRQTPRPLTPTDNSATPVHPNMFLQTGELTQDGSPSPQRTGEEIPVSRGL